MPSQRCIRKKARRDRWISEGQDPLANFIRHWHTYSAKSQAMILIGLAWIITATSIMTESSLYLSGVFHMSWPAPIRVIISLGPGIFSIYSGITRKHKAQALGMLMFMPAIRCASYMWSTFVYFLYKMDIDRYLPFVVDPPPGYKDGWSQAAIYFALMVGIWGLTKLPSIPGED